MNRIYKVIWSKVKHQYVVTSEFAHSCTKSTTSRVGKGALAALAAFVLTAGVGGVQAAEYEVTVGDSSNTTSVSITEEELQEMLSDAGIPVGTVNGEHSIAIGEKSRVKDGSQFAMAIGYDAMAAKDNTLAVGTSAVAGSKGAIAIGTHAKANYGLNAMAIGNYSTATGEEAIAAGKEATAGGDYSVAIGAGSDAAADNSIAIGKGAKVEANQGGNADNSIALGVDSLVTGNHSVALGSGATATNSNATAIGDDSHATGGHSSAFGQQSYATAESATALGYNARATAKNSVALGAGSIADEEGTISVGRSVKDSPQYDFQRRITDVAAGINDFDAVNVKQMKDAVTDATVGAGMVQWDSTTDETTGEPTYHEGMLGGVQFKGDGILSSAKGESYLELNEYGASLNMNTTYAHVTDGVATIASGTNRLQVTEEDGTVVDGDFSAGSGQFKVLEDGTIVAFNGNSSFALDDSGIGAKYANNMMNVDSTGVHLSANGLSTVDVTARGTTFSALGHTGTTVISGDSITTGTINAGKMTVDGKNVATVDDVTNATKDAVKYDENGELHAGQDGTGKLDLDKENGSASLTSGNGAHSIVVNNEGTTVNGGLTVKGGLNITDSEGNTTSVATDADLSTIKGQIGVGEGQTVSNALTNKGETLVAGINQNTADISKNAAAIGDVSALKGTNASGDRYTNLTDAVNGNYDRIEQNTTAIAQNSQAINTLGHQVSDLGDEIDSVGAISAALAGLHPLDYDGTGSKFQISAAMGTYDGTQAAAIGGFYHFNRDVMMSLGGATSFEGDKKTAANIGVTFRVGEGASGKTVSNDILARLEAMDQKIAALEQENKELKNVLGAIDTSLSKEFPDVPANHWAYEAVTKLAGNDVVDGYPDGEFHGDRTMTRYEMAEIIYKAMSKGVQVDQKLVDEFKPEMEQVAANTEGAETTPAAAAETAQPAEENA